MALVITNPTFVPPGGWYRIVAPQSGAEFRHHTPDGVGAKYREHCKANGYPEPSEQDIIDLICKSTNANICQGDGYAFKDRSIHFRDVVNGTRVLASFKLAGSPLVSEEEANRRAAICKDCPENVMYARDCALCNDLEDAVKAIIGDVKTEYDDRLMACFICGCSNKAQIWIPGEFLKKGVDEAMLKRFREVLLCWKTAAVEEA